MEQIQRDMLARIEARLEHIQQAQADQARAQSDRDRTQADIVRVVGAQTVLLRKLRTDLVDLSEESATQDERLWGMIEKVAQALAQSDALVAQTARGQEDLRSMATSMAARWQDLKVAVETPLKSLADSQEVSVSQSWKAPKNVAILLASVLPLLALISMLWLTYRGDLQWAPSEWRVPGLVGHPTGYTPSPLVGPNDQSETLYEQAIPEGVPAPLTNEVAP